MKSIVARISCLPVIPVEEVDMMLERQSKDEATGGKRDKERERTPSRRSGLDISEITPRSWRRKVSVVVPIDEFE